MDGVIWAGILGVGVLYEAYALWRDKDGTEPLTWWVRRVMGYSHLFRWWVIAFCIWLTFHFAVGLN